MRLLLTVLFCYALSCFAQEVQLPFIENKGQWPEQVIAKTDINGGVVFFENNRLSYNLLDMSKFPHADHNQISDEEKKTLTFPGHVFRTVFLDAKTSPNIEKKDKLISYYNYFLGSDSSKWAGNCLSYAQLNYSEIYPGIDLHYYSKESSLKYDFVVQPGADPSQIRIVYEGVDSTWLDKEGNLNFATHTGIHKELKPVVYQVIDGKTKSIPCDFELKANQLSFKFPKRYNKSHPLIIDPELIFSTYSGSNADNFGYSATYDTKGNLFAAGSVFSQGYITTVGAYDRNYAGNGVLQNSNSTDIGITKISSNGSTRLYSTYLGGFETELPHSLIVDENDQLLVFGTTSSTDFPTSTNAYDKTFNGGTAVDYTVGNNIGVLYKNGADIFVSKFSANGASLLASTYLGGSGNDGLNDGALRYNYADQIRGEVQIDTLTGEIYVASCTQSSDFPLVNGMGKAYSGKRDGVLIKLKQDLSDIIWSNLIGGDEDDAVYTLDFTKGNLLIAGSTVSDTLTYMNIPDSIRIQAKRGGLQDGFVMLMPTSGDTIFQYTHWGSAKYDQVYLAETDADGFIYVLGQTEDNTNRFYDTSRFGQTKSGQFLSKFNPTLDTLIWTTTIGQSDSVPNISPVAMLVDFCRRIIFMGWGGGFNRGNEGNRAGTIFKMPTKVTGVNASSPFYRTSTGASSSGEFYMAMLEPDAEDVIFACFYGSPGVDDHVDGGTSRFDKNAIIYQSVCACRNSTFPIAPSASSVISSTNASFNCNNASFKINFDPNIILADFDLPQLICAQNSGPVSVSPTNKSEGGKQYAWDFGNGTTSTDRYPTAIFQPDSEYTVTLRIFDEGSCNVSSSITKKITVISSGALPNDTLEACFGDKKTIGISALNFTGVSYVWSPSTGLKNPNDAISELTVTENQDYLLTISYQGCTKTFKQNVKVEKLNLIASDDTTFCAGTTPLKLVANSMGTSSNFTWSLSTDFIQRINTAITDSTVTVNPTEQTTYYIRAVTATCNQTDTIVVKPIQINNQLNPELLFCLRDTVTINSMNNKPGYTYKWSGNTSIIGRTDTTFLRAVPSNNAIYKLKTTSIEGCIRNDSIKLKASPLSGISNATINFSPTKVLKNNPQNISVSPNGNYTYLWEPSNLFTNPTQATTEFTPIADPTEIYVTVSDGYCKLKKNLSLKVSDAICGIPNFFIPNAFTPNGDGENDEVFLRGEFVKTMKLSIFDRLGTKVFDTERQDIGWDGKLNGVLLDPQVFVYQLDVLCIDLQRYNAKGNITLIR